jgi:hypothetical protein
MPMSIRTRFHGDPSAFRFRENGTIDGAMFQTSNHNSIFNACYAVAVEL